MTITPILPNGVALAPISTGSYDQSQTSLALIGQGTTGVAETLANDLLALLVNFASPFAPNNPLQGQLWFNSGSTTLNYFDGANWIALGQSSTPASTPSPVGPDASMWATIAGRHAQTSQAAALTIQSYAEATQIAANAAKVDAQLSAKLNYAFQQASGNIAASEAASAAAVANARAAVAAAQSAISNVSNIGAQLGLIQNSVNGVNTAITNETASRVSNANAIVGSLNGLTASFNTANSSLTTLQALQASNSTALAGLIQALQANVVGANAAITSNQVAQVSNAAALAALIQTLTANIAGANATIVNNQVVQIANAQALAALIQTLQANVAGANSTISSNQVAQVSNASALATLISGLTSSLAGANATILQNYTTLSSNANAMATTIAGLTASLAGANAAILSNSIAWVANAAAQAAVLNTLTSNIAGANATIATNYTTFIQNATALAGMISNVAASLGAANAAVQANSIALASNIAAQAALIQGVQAGLNTANAYIQANSTAWVSNASAQAAQINGLTTNIAGANSSILALQVALSNTNNAYAGLVTTINANVAGANAAILALQSAQAGANSATAIQFSGLNANVQGANSTIASNYLAYTTSNSAITNAITNLLASIAGANSTISNNYGLMVSNASSQALLIQSLTTNLAGANATITNNYNTFVSNAGGLSQTIATQTGQISALQTGLNTANAAILSNATAWVSNASAQANLINVLNANIAGANATLTVHGQAIANLNSLTAVNWIVNATTSGGTAIIQANSTSYGTNIMLGAQNIYQGPNYAFNTPSNTAQWRSGSIVRMDGMNFGYYSNLIMWVGPISITANSATTSNCNFALDSSGKAYYGGNPLSAWSTVPVTQYTPAQILSPNINEAPNGEFSAGSTSWVKLGTNTLHTATNGPGGLAWYGYSTGNAIHNNTGIPATAGALYSFSGWTNAIGIPSGTGQTRLIYQFCYANSVVALSGLIVNSLGGVGWQEGIVNGIQAPTGTASIVIVADTSDMNGVQNHANNGNPFAGNSGLQVGWAGVKVEQSASATPLQGAQSTTTGAVYADGSTMDYWKPAAQNADATLPTISANPLQLGSQYLSGFGSIAGQNSLAYGSGYLTGFGGVAGQNSLAYGSGYLTGFGSIAGQSNISYGSQYLSGFGSLAPLNNDRSLVAGSINGQGPWAAYQGFSPTAVTQPSFNLCYNGDFSLGWEGWTTQAGNQPGVSKVANAYPGIFFAVTGANGIWTNDIAIIGGGNYSFQVNLYNGAKDGHLRMLVQWLNSSKNFVSESANTIYVGYCPANGGWQTKQLGNQVSPPDAAYARVYIDTTPDDASQTGAGVDFSNGGAIAWSGVKVEFGSQCTPMSREGTTGSLYYDGTSVNQLRPATTQADETSNATAARFNGQGPWAVYQPAIPGYILNGTNYGSQNGNSGQTGTIDCAWVTWGTYDGTTDGNGHTLSSHMGYYDQTGRLLQGQALPINTQLAASYLYSNGQAFSSYAGSGTIQCASQTLYIVNQSFNLPSGSCSSLQTGQSYSMFYDFVAGVYVAISAGNGSGYYQNPSRYGYAGSCYCPAAGGGTGGGGGNRGVQP